MATQDLRRVYYHVIDDVVAKMKPEFVQESVDESVLHTIRQRWAAKLTEKGIITEGDAHDELLLKRDEDAAAASRKRLHDGSGPAGRQDAGPGAAGLPAGLPLVQPQGAGLGPGVPPPQLLQHGPHHGMRTPLPQQALGGPRPGQVGMGQPGMLHGLAQQHQALAALAAVQQRLHQPQPPQPPQQPGLQQPGLQPQGLAGLAPGQAVVQGLNQLRQLPQQQQQAAMQLLQAQLQAQQGMRPAPQPIGVPGGQPPPGAALGPPPGHQLQPGGLAPPQLQPHMLAQHHPHAALAGMQHPGAAQHAQQALLPPGMAPHGVAPQGPGLMAPRVQGMLQPGLIPQQDGCSDAPPSLQEVAAMAGMQPERLRALLPARIAAAIERSSSGGGGGSSSSGTGAMAGGRLAAAAAAAAGPGAGGSVRRRGPARGEPSSGKPSSAGAAQAQAQAPGQRRQRIPQLDGDDGYEDEGEEPGEGEAEPEPEEADEAEDSDEADIAKLDDDLDALEEADKEETGDVGFALYEKVHRAKNRWRCNLRYGVFFINNKEYMFNKASTDLTF